ncbi:MAG: hypothetical protein IKZ92_05705 [Muribaculaceae bacterium]|nr:hypothetical protein [Muribaculaceae bacterium]
MRKIIIQGLLACLLALFPGLMPAQTLTSYEYWFDDDVDGRQTGTLSGTNDAVTFYADARRLSQGIHRLNFRARQSDGSYSAVTTSVFIKVAAGVGNKLEYWIDDDRSNLRVIEGSLASDGEDYIFNKDLDMRAVSPGLHRLNLRPRSTSGLTSGAITTADFIKISTGTADKLEYWLDGDRSTVHVIEGTQASDGSGYVFVNDLDLGDVTPGYHRLYYRAVSSTDLTASAVCMSPIIVKSRYYHDENEAVVMKKYSISVDDETPEIHDVLRPKEDFPYNKMLDARYLSLGQHTLKATFWNSMGMSVSVEQPFTVKLPEPGEIMLTATEQDGLVKLEYNNVPNNVKHSVLRAKPGGRWFPVHTIKESCSPDVASHYIDIPSAAGTYNYKVRSRYENFDGSTDTVGSNVVTVNVPHTKDELTNYGYIIGQVPDMYPLIKHAYFSDGEHVPFTGNHFSREMIPVGTELTIEVIESSNSETYYQPVTLTVKAGENLVNFEPLTGSERPYYDEHHLEFASDLEWTGMNFTFDVKCHASKRWKGRVRLRVISKKEYEENSGDDGSGGLNPSGDAGTQAGAVAPMPNVDVQKNYYYTYSEPFTLDPGKTTTVTLSLDNLFPDKKKEHYLCFFESEGQWRDGVESMDEIRLLEINRAYNVTENPEDRLIDKNLLEQAKEEVLKQDAEYAANLILMIANYIKSFDGILGKTIETCDIVKAWSLYEVNISESDYNAMMKNALNSETWDEFIHSDVVKKAPVTVFADFGSELSTTLRDDVVSDILKYDKGVQQYLSKAMSVLKYVNKYKEWEQLNTYERSFYCLEAILNAYEKTNPFAKLVKPYVEVGRSMIAKALEYGEVYNAGYEAQDLYEGKIKFKIKVQTNLLVDFNFAYHGTSAIREVKVMAANRDEWDKTMVDTIYFEPEGVWDGVMLRQTRYSGIDPMTGGGNLEFGKPLQRLWMEIKWKNGRTSKIPLVGKNEEVGVNYSSLDRRYTVHFKSGSTKYKNIADIIQLTNHKTL